MTAQSPYSKNETTKRLCDFVMLIWIIFFSAVVVENIAITEENDKLKDQLRAGICHKGDGL